MIQIIVRNIIYILFIVYFFKRTKHGLHMLQLESYKNERYAKWMKQNKKVLYFGIPKGKSKKPFVVTNRIKRMYTTYLIGLIVLFTFRKFISNI